MLPIQVPEYTGIVIGTVIYGAAAAAFLYQCGVALMDAWLARSAKTWPKAQGHVLSSTVQYVYKAGYVPTITYQYFVAGRCYRSTRVQIGRSAYDGRTADVLLKRYSPGRTITAYYHPRYKGQAYLKPGKPYAAIRLLVSALGYLLLASLVVALMLSTVYDQLAAGR